MKKSLILLGLLAAFFMTGILSASLSFADENKAPSKLKALIVDGQNNHNWQETTPVLKDLLLKSGRFDVAVATTPSAGKDMSSFAPVWSDYDVIVMNYTGDSWSKSTNEAFEKYVKNGGGLVIFHAADNAFADWKEFNEMIALGGWGGRNEKSGPYLYIDKEGKEVRDMTPGSGGNHGPQWEYLIDIRDTEHPITKGLPKEFRHASDELYQQLRGPAKNVKILATAYADPSKGGTDRFEPQLMVIEYGQGKVFHIAYGHAGKQCKAVSFIVPFVRGTEWAATGEVTIPVPEDMPGKDKPTFRD